jgi:hypothetical protein
LEAGAVVSTTQLGLQRSKRLPDTYVPGTMPERLYKRAQMAHDNDDGAFILNAEGFAPTAKELAVVEAEVSDKALTDAIETVRKTVRSGRYIIPSQKVVLNKAQEKDTQLALR